MTKALRPPAPKAELATNAADPTSLVQYAISRGVTPAELKDLMDLAQRERDRLAAERFGEAFARFQEECPQISKTNVVMNKPDKGGGERYRFASLEDIDKTVRPILAAHKLSTSGTISVEADGIKVRWVIQLGSHKEVREYSLPKVAATGIAQGVNAVQDMGAWMTYIRRYTYVMALGLIVTEEDTDGNTIADIVAATEEQKAELRGLIEQAGTPMDKFLKFAQRDRPEEERSFDNITHAEYRKVAAAWRTKVAGMKGGAA